MLTEHRCPPYAAEQSFLMGDKQLKMFHLEKTNMIEDLTNAVT